MNLSTARSSKRSGEVDIRKALGHEKSALIWQFLSESLLISVFAFLLAVGFVWLLTPLFELADRLDGKTHHWLEQFLSAYRQKLRVCGIFFGKLVVFS